ncbi:hypothetical protein [Flavobacterium sp.]|uniref:hypothetical protein n=1 Tax=Flavobacterium sp. TaxID=239 RepID=UPI00286A869A|nr:hypothetical protein [Flavobacterium sp.]
MTDIRLNQTVPRTFVLEQTIAENESYKFANRFLVGLTLVMVLGTVVYFIRMQRQADESYNSKNK